MIEYRSLYVRSAKQDIIYRGYLPRVSLVNEVYHSAREIISDLIEIKVDVILCITATERVTQLMRAIVQLSTPFEANQLLNQTKWWFASRLDNKRGETPFPDSYTATEDRREIINHFSSTMMKTLLNAILRTYIRLPSSSSIMSPTNCAIPQNVHQLKKTRTFIR